MKRSAIKPKRPEWTPTPKEDRPMAVLPAKVECRASYGAAATVAVPKGEKAKPGKRAPTAEERAWMDRVTAFGCIACWMDGNPNRPAAVHHILRGGVRMGHLYTLPLCDPGHHQNGQQFGMVSRHPWKAQFEAKYGGEMELLERLRAEIQACA